MSTQKEEFNWSKWGFWISLIPLIPYGFFTSLQQIADNYIDFGIAIFVIFLIGLFLKGKEKTYIKYFIVFELLFVFLAIGILSFPYFREKQNFREKQKIRVAILLPFTGGDALREDGEAQLKGIFKFIGNEGQAYTNEIEYVFLDHKNKADEAKKLIEKEITEMHTRYFFSTMSSVNSQLADHFYKTKLENNPILVCGVTSFPKIETKCNSVYRYYVRSSDEAHVLAEEAKNDGIETIIPIVVDDNYGKGALEAFQESFKFSENSQAVIEAPIKYANGTKKEDIKTSIQKRCATFNFNQKKVGIMIAHYGSGIDDIISSLAELGVLSRKQPILYVTSTLHSKNWSIPIKPILDTIPNCIAVPNYSYSIAPQTLYEENVEDFSQFAFKKLIKSIILIKKDKKSFEETWNSSDIINIPEELSQNSTYLKNGDTEIKMKTISKNIER